MSKADMFLRLVGARSGPVRGEADDESHRGDMVVLAWAWGMSGGSTMGSGTAARTALSEIRISRAVDSASTALMSIMRNNDVVKSAQLTVRKAGGSAVDYFVVKIKDGRITSYEVSSAGSGELGEALSIAFSEIEIEYREQTESGSAKGSTTFHATVNSAQR